jgi:TolB-like protein
MKKLFVLYLLIALGINSFAQDTRPVSLNEAIRSAMQYLAGQIAPNSKIVVLNFSAPTEELSNYIIEDLSDHIVNSRTLTVVDRRSLEALRQELNFQMSGEVSDETAQSIGKILGAQSIISGSISPLGSNYRFRVQAVEVETAALQGGQSATVMEDETLAALLGNSYTPPRQASRSSGQRFAIGAQAGTLYGLGTNYYDTEGVGNFGFFGSFYGAFALSSVFRLQFGVNIVMNDLHSIGEYRSHEETKDFKYTSLDIPLLANFYLSPSSNVLLRIGAGPYLSLPLGDLEYKDHFFNDPWATQEDKFPVDSPVVFGFLGGLGAGYRIGNGYIVLDIRYLMDFSPIKLDSLYITGEFTRRGITALVGYEHWF